MNINPKPPFTDRELRIARNVANGALEAAMELVAEWIAITEWSIKQEDDAILAAWISQLSHPQAGLLDDLSVRVLDHLARNPQ